MQLFLAGNGDRAQMDALQEGSYADIVLQLCIKEAQARAVAQWQEENKPGPGPSNR